MLARLFGRIARLSPVWVGILAGLGVPVTVMAVSLMLYFASVAAIDHEVKTDLKRIAAVVASQVNGDVHDIFQSPEQESSESYAAAIAPLAKIVEASPEIAFVYTVVKKGDQVYFVLDPTEEGDEDKDGVDDKSHIMQVYEDAGADMLRAFSSGEPHADGKPYSDIWGTFISGYAPIKDGSGKVVAVAGVDLKADRYLHRLDGVHRAGRYALVLAIAITLLAGFFAFRAQGGALASRAKIAQRERELEAAHTELENQNLALEGQNQKLAKSMASEQMANQRMKAASQRFEKLFQGIPSACFTFDANGTLFEWNDQFENLLGCGTSELFQQPLTNVFSGRAAELLSNFDGTPIHDNEVQETLKSGQERTLVLRAFSLDSEGTRIGGIGSLIDVTERKHLEDQVQHQLEAQRELNRILDEQKAQLEVLSTTDGLTQVRNRRFLEDALRQMFNDARRHDRPLSVLLMDVDKFKQFNDTFGHQEGDTVLKKVAAALSDTARDADIVARYGGEEFCILLPQTTADEAMVAAERLRTAIENQDWPLRLVTASFGVATLSEEATPDELLRHADEAMYFSKESGRNRCTHFEGLPREEAA